jgi:hypothetical protein
MEGPKWTDVAIVILTIGIVFFALMQWLEMRGSGRQTDQLVSYAKAQADAARDQSDAAQQFSDTAEDINGGIADATDQLEAAANNAKRSIEATQDAMRLEQRAWVALKPTATGPLYFNNEGAWLPINVVMTNIGHSPARYVKLWEKLVVSLAPPTSEEIETTCALLKKPPASKETNGWVLFPTEIGEQLYPGFASKKDIDASLMNSGIPGMVGFNLILCADYTMTFDSRTHHQTRQAFAITWYDMNRGGIAMGAFDPKSTQPVPVSLVLRIGGFTD